MNNTVHYHKIRRARRQLIEDIGRGRVIDAFEIDRGHPKGAEIHSVTDTAIIIIANKQSHKIITEIIARPKQLKKLYEHFGREPPQQILRLAYLHNRKKYNHR